MNQTVYVCTGGCGGEIIQEQYDQGLTRCGTKGCSRDGQPFDKRLKCASCGALYEEGETHSCQ